MLSLLSTVLHLLFFEVLLYSSGLQLRTYVDAFVVVSLCQLACSDLTVHKGGYCAGLDTVPWKWPVEQELARKPARVPRHQYSKQVGAAMSGSG
jgi:hypothetical protein